MQQDICCLYDSVTLYKRIACLRGTDRGIKTLALKCFINHLLRMFLDLPLNAANLKWDLACLHRHRVDKTSTLQVSEPYKEMGKQGMETAPLWQTIVLIFTSFSHFCHSTHARRVYEGVCHENKDTLEPPSSSAHSKVKSHLREIDRRTKAMCGFTSRLFN